MSNHIRPVVLLVASICVFGLVSCVSLQPEKMVPDKTTFGAHHNHSVALDVGGGNASIKWYSGTVNAGELEKAVRLSIEKSHLFSKVTDKPAADYIMAVNLDYASSHPGFNRTAWFNTTWSISERATGKSIWSKSYQTQGKSTVGDAFNGEKRSYIAVERAGKINLDNALTDIGKLNLNAR